MGAFHAFPGPFCLSLYLPLHALSRLNIISPCGVEFFGTLEIAYHFPKCIIVRRLTLAERHELVCILGLTLIDMS